MGGNRTERHLENAEKEIKHLRRSVTILFWLLLVIGSLPVYIAYNAYQSSLERQKIAMIFAEEHQKLTSYVLELEYKIEKALSGEKEETAPLPIEPLVPALQPSVE